MSESQHDGQYVDQEAPAPDGPDLESPASPGAAEAPERTEDAEHPEDPEPDMSAAAPSRAEHTGNPVVDSVLDSLEELDRLPPSEHVAVFEAAHERLRGALSDAGEPPADA